MGVTNIMMDAATLTSVTKAGLKALPTEMELMEAFDIGVVGMEIIATEQKLLDPASNEEFKRIKIAERIYEVNGADVKTVYENMESVEEDTVVGQVVDIYKNGTMVRQKACPMKVGSELMPHVKNKVTCFKKCK
jgi:hypothetical protein